MVWASFWRGLGKVFGSQKAIEARKVEKWKIGVSLKRELNFQGSGACFWRPKSITNRIRKRNAFWNTFLLIFTPFWTPKVSTVGSQSDAKNTSGFYAENGQPEVSQPKGDPPLKQRGTTSQGVHETHFFQKIEALACTRRKIDLFDFDLSL